ncbi:large conductance mechanosensitive channel protein MscL [Nakamurella leprariae]|uniref:Large-conductance mechanosensitive channel n=1 Tax=Nakamurella leprariae TaxID=2803911 RepID=A0A939C1S0_9ACTN|nr:large conductance mechanosensitive channel protein MscL [Nakamurella leprariae]
MLRGFKDFILRGNVISLAIAVVIGAAFTAVVTAFTTNVIQPLLNAVGSVDAGGLGFRVVPSKPESFVNIGALITALITFVITAAVVYFVFVAPMNAINARLAARKTPVKADPTEIEILLEIRDLLRDGATPAEVESRLPDSPRPAVDPTDGPTSR